MFFCKICNYGFASERALHSHISKDEKLLICEYYHKYYPRRDLYDGKFIEFKNKEFYFKNDFNSRRNFSSWARKSKPEDVLKYSEKKLLERIKDKGLKFAPCHVELRSLMLPSINGWDTLCGINKYLNFCSENGCVSRFDYFDVLNGGTKVKKIYADSREKLPWQFGVEMEIKKIQCGDYMIDDSNLAIERKSLQDIVGTLSVNNYDRFFREVERAKKNGIYLVVLCESSLSSVMNYVPKKFFGQRVYGAFIFNRIRELLQTFDNLQFCFTEKNYNTIDIAMSIFENCYSVCNIDIQYYLENNLLCGSKGLTQ